MDSITLYVIEVEDLHGDVAEKIYHIHERKARAAYRWLISLGARAKEPYTLEQ